MYRRRNGDPNERSEEQGSDCDRRFAGDRFGGGGATRRRRRIMRHVIVITGASSGFGALAARALAHAGHTVYATMRETIGRNAPQVAEVARYAVEHGVDLRTVELDVASSESVETGIATIVAGNGRLDVVVHNAGHMSFGP